MNVQRIQTDPTAAQALLRKYKEHMAWSKPIDHEIVRIAKMVASGKVIINALASIANQGANAQGLPKLAIARADWKKVYLNLTTDGRAIMHDHEGNWLPSRMSASRRFDWPAGTFPPQRQARRCEAIVPLIPLDIRPKRGLQNYHILFEAEWSNVVPIDPILMRRIGSGDQWLVLEQWELTDIERMVLAAHLPGATH